MSPEDAHGDPDGNQAKPPSGAAGEGTLMASSPQRAVIYVDGISAWAGPAWRAEVEAACAQRQFPDSDIEITIEPEGDA